MITSMERSLREGFTTGTAAAAAAAAAVGVLLGDTPPVSVSVPLPPFARIDARVDWSANARLDVPVSQAIAPAFVPALAPDSTSAVTDAPRSASACVIKDGGDDPDATHGMAIIVHASCRPFAPEPLEFPDSANAPETERMVLPPLIIPGFPNTILLYGGLGIGLVTLPGLPVAPGEPAINPQPRRQIAAAACEAAARHGYAGPLYLYIAVPEGKERAAHTLNARLGIIGGISILGTSGIVRPYSNDSWKAAILQGIAVAAAAGVDTLLLATGRRSEKALFRLYPDLPPQAGVQAADFAAFSIRSAVHRPFRRLAWGCFPGKLLKLAQGLEWTHAKTAPADIPLLGAIWQAHGGCQEVAASIAALPTAMGAFALMHEVSPPLHDAVLADLAARAGDILLGWMCDEHSRSGAGHPLPELSLHVFSLEGELLLSHRCGSS